MASSSNSHVFGLWEKVREDDHFLKGFFTFSTQHLPSKSSISSCWISECRRGLRPVGDQEKQPALQNSLHFLFTAAALSVLARSVYISEARVRVCCSLTTRARHSAHGGLDKLHLEGSFAVSWNARCGRKTISHLFSASAPGWKHLNPSDSLSVSSRQHSAALRSAVCLFRRCRCDDISRLICCISVCCTAVNLQQRLAQSTGE